MTAVSELSKLAELRAKTDQDLVLIIRNTLELGVRFASAAINNDGSLHGRAEAIHTNMALLLPKVEDVTERRRLEEKLKRLRDSLDRLAPSPAASASAVQPSWR